LSADPAGGALRLADWIQRLAEGLAAERGAPGRLQAVVGDRRARISLDDDMVVVAMVDEKVVVLPDDASVTGSGTTTFATIIALLDGRLDLTEALRDGHAAAQGRVEDLTAMLHAVEILLDVATRVPAMRSAAAAFRASRTPELLDLHEAPARATADEELRMLRRLGLADGEL
jgi:hypothetical protein